MTLEAFVSLDCYFAVMLQYVDMFTEKHLLRFVITKRSFRYHSPVFVLQFTNPMWINFGLGVVCCFLCRRWHRCILQESSMSLHWWWRTFMTAHTHPFNGPFSGTTWVGRYQKGKTNLDFTEARDSEWKWHQLGHMQVCTSLHTDNHASTPPLSFLQAG